MRIHDYEAGKVLKDVEIALTREEVEDLAAYLARMLASPEVKSVQLIDVSRGVVDSELSVSFVA